MAFIDYDKLFDFEGYDAPFDPRPYAQQQQQPMDPFIGRGVTAALEANQAPVGDYMGWEGDIAPGGTAITPTDDYGLMNRAGFGSPADWLWEFMDPVLRARKYFNQAELMSGTPARADQARVHVNVAQGSTPTAELQRLQRDQDRTLLALERELKRETHGSIPDLDAREQWADEEDFQEDLGKWYDKRSLPEGMDPDDIREYSQRLGRGNPNVQLYQDRELGIRDPLEQMYKHNMQSARAPDIREIAAMLPFLLGVSQKHKR